MRVVVTGGAGFIGANLCRTLTDRGVDVVVVDDLSTGNAANLAGLDVRLQVGSVLDPALLDPVLSGADSVVHLAAVASVPASLDDPARTHEVNATGTLRVLEAARRAGCQVLVASSSAVYGAHPAARKSEDLAPDPLSPYAASKLAAEGYAAAYQHSFGLPVLVFRFFNVFGPLQPASHVYAAVVPAFVSAVLAGRPVTVFGDGRQTRDFTFVGAVAALLADAACGGRSHPGPVNLASGTSSTLLELISLLEAVLGRRVPVEFAPPRPGDIRDSRADTSRLQQLFPGGAHTDLRHGVESTVGWFRAAG